MVLTLHTITPAVYHTDTVCRYSLQICNVHSKATSLVWRKSSSKNWGNKLLPFNRRQTTQEQYTQRRCFSTWVRHRRFANYVGHCRSATTTAPLNRYVHHCVYITYRLSGFAATVCQGLCTQTRLLPWDCM